MGKLITFKLGWELQQQKFMNLSSLDKLEHKFLLFYDGIGYRFKAILFPSPNEKDQFGFHFSYDYGHPSRINLEYTIFTKIQRSCERWMVDSWNGRTEMVLGTDEPHISIDRVFTIDRHSLRDKYGLDEKDLSWTLWIRIHLKVPFNVYEFSIEPPIARSKMPERHTRLFDHLKIADTNESDMELITCDGARFYGHRFVFASADASLSTSGLMRRLAAGDLHLFSSLTEESLGALLRYIYTGVLQTYDDRLSVIDLIALAVFSDQYDLDDVRQSCEACLWTISRYSFQKSDLIEIALYSMERNTMLFNRTLHSFKYNISRDCEFHLIDRRLRDDPRDRRELLDRYRAFIYEHVYYDDVIEE